MYPVERLITPNNDLIVSLAVFKENILWDASDTSQDTTMTRKIKAVTNEAKNFIGRDLQVQKWANDFNRFYSVVTLSRNPIDTSSIVVKYYDSNDDQQELNASEYKVIDGGLNGFVSIKFDGTMPELYDKPNAVSVEYNAGYATIPDDIIDAIVAEASTQFELRQHEFTGAQVSQVSRGFYAKLYPYKMFYHNTVLC